RWSIPITIARRRTLPAGTIGRAAIGTIIRTPAPHPLTRTRTAISHSLQFILQSFQPTIEHFQSLHQFRRNLSIARRTIHFARSRRRRGAIAWRRAIAVTFVSWRPFAVARARPVAIAWWRTTIVIARRWATIGSAKLAPALLHPF